MSPDRPIWPALALSLATHAAGVGGIAFAVRSALLTAGGAAGASLADVGLVGHANAPVRAPAPPAAGNPPATTANAGISPVAADSPASTAEPSTAPGRAAAPNAGIAGSPDATLVGGYLSRARERVHGHVVYPLALQRRGVTGRVLLHVEILSDGRLGSAEIGEGSGQPELDRLALAAVHGAAPFPAFGKELGSTDRLKFSLPVDFRINK